MSPIVPFNQELGLPAGPLMEAAQNTVEKHKALQTALKRQTEVTNSLIAKLLAMPCNTGRLLLPPPPVNSNPDAIIRTIQEGTETYMQKEIATVQDKVQAQQAELDKLAAEDAAQQAEINLLRSQLRK